MSMMSIIDMIKTILKSSVVWIMMVIAAILNGLFRENVLIPGLGASKALPLSGIFLSLFVLVIIAVSIGIFGKLKVKEYFMIGGFWVVLTLIFEIGLGVIVRSRSLEEIIQLFNIFTGNFFLLVLLTTFFSPWITAKLRKII